MNVNAAGSIGMPGSEGATNALFDGNMCLCVTIKVNFDNEITCVLGLFETRLWYIKIFPQNFPISCLNYGHNSVKSQIGAELSLPPTSFHLRLTPYTSQHGRREVIPVADRGQEFLFL